MLEHSQWRAACLSVINGPHWVFLVNSYGFVILSTCFPSGERCPSHVQWHAYSHKVAERTEGHCSIFREIFHYAHNHSQPSSCYTLGSLSWAPQKVQRVLMGSPVACRSVLAWYPDDHPGSWTSLSGREGSLNSATYKFSSAQLKNAKHGGH